MTHTIRIRKTQPQPYTEWFKDYGIKMISYPTDHTQISYSIPYDEVWWESGFKRLRNGVQLIYFDFHFSDDRKDLSLLFKLTFG